MFFLHDNSKVVIMGIQFPNLIKKWLFESLQRPCNILYLLHHHSSTFIDTSIIFKTPNKALLVLKKKKKKRETEKEREIGIKTVKKTETRT